LDQISGTQGFERESPGLIKGPSGGEMGFHRAEVVIVEFIADVFGLLD
jgi:hypothetical protein